MSVLRTIEQKIEGLFEGVFGRAFRTHVQPVELARKLAKEMDDHRSVSVSRIYVPNEYTVFLSGADRGEFESYEESLLGELQDYLAEHGRREGYALLSPPRVLLKTDDDLSVGEFGIATRMVQPEDRSVRRPPAAAPPPVELEASATIVYKARAPEAEVEPPVERDIVTLEVEGRQIAVTERHVVLGRAQECEIRLTDANVSRRHAEVRQEDATYWLVDLGSTNGTLLNGVRVERARLSDGDRITVGETVAVFRRALP